MSKKLDKTELDKTESSMPEKVTVDKAAIEKASKSMGAVLALPKEPPKPKYVVAPGKSMTSCKGNLEPGDAVNPGCFHKGQKTFDKWLERGYITENK